MAIIGYGNQGQAHALNLRDSGIDVVVGNRDDDTEGCLLVGDNCSQNVTEEGSITASRSAYERIYPKVAAALEQDEEVTITYIDYDGGA